MKVSLNGVKIYSKSIVKCMSILQNIPGSMQFPWEIGKNNRAKNRYGNIVSCEYISLIFPGVMV